MSWLVESRHRNACKQTSPFLQFERVAVFSLTKMPVSSIKMQIALSLWVYFWFPVSWCAHCDVGIMDFLLLWYFEMACLVLRTILHHLFCLEWLCLFEASCVYIRVFRCFFHFCEGGSATEPAGGFGPRLFQQHLSMWGLIFSFFSFVILPSWLGLFFSCLIFCCCIYGPAKT